MKNEKRLVSLIAGVQFINILEFMMVMPLGPDFAAALGIPTSQLGLIGGLYFAMFYCVLAIPVGSALGYLLGGLLGLVDVDVNAPPNSIDATPTAASNGMLTMAEGEADGRASEDEGDS